LAGAEVLGGNYRFETRFYLDDNRESSLTPKEREVINLVVSQVNDCEIAGLGLWMLLPQLAARSPPRDRSPVLEDAERLIAAWNEHQAKRTPTNE
jgi:Carboxymuconolactone decarboxylase family